MVGEPLEPENLEAVKQIAALAKKHHKDVIVWTGYYVDELSKEQLKALKDVDWVVDRSLYRRT